MSDVTKAPAGWYDDMSPGLLRWWDGQAWTEQRVAKPQPVQIVTPLRRPTNHVLHLLLSVLTFGLWLPVWFIVAMTNRSMEP